MSCSGIYADREAKRMWAETIAFAAGASTTSAIWLVRAASKKRTRQPMTPTPIDKVMTEEIRNAVRRVAEKFADPIGATLVTSSLLDRQQAKDRVETPRGGSWRR